MTTPGGVAWSPLNSATLAADPALAAALLALNNAHAAELSWLEPARLAALVDQAFIASAVIPGDALLLAFDQNADYDSANFLWFRARFARFVYIDRIVLAAAMRGSGLAERGYRQVFAQAAAQGHHHAVCEINSDPPNPGSVAFHRRLDFIEIGQALLQNGKRVAYFERRAAPAPS